MKTVLFATELAGAEDALAPLAAIAESLRDLDLKCAFALPDLGAGYRLLDRQAAVLPAPQWPAQKAAWRADEIADYADILALVGFAEPGSLPSVVGAWERLVELIGPDLVVAQHAPGLVVALAGTGLPLVLVGNPYTLPPIGRGGFAPLAAGRVPVLPHNRLIEPLARLVAERGRAMPENLAAPFAAPDRFVYGTPELDVYGAHRREDLLAPPGTVARFAEPPEPPRVFLAMDAGFVGLAAVVQALAELDVEVMAYLGGEAGQVGAFLAAREAAVFAERPDLGRVMASASHVISHGDGLIAEAALHGGRPHLAVPLSHEGVSNARLAERAGIATIVSSIKDSAELRPVLAAFLCDKAMAEAARHAAEAAAARERRGLVETAREAIAAKLTKAAAPSRRGAARARPARSRRRSMR